MTPVSHDRVMDQPHARVDGPVFAVNLASLLAISICIATLIARAHSGDVRCALMAAASIVGVEIAWLLGQFAIHSSRE